MNADFAVSDAAAREQAVQSDGSVIVQAPAGSGKTTLLTERYLRMLAKSNAPERVLAITFTRRAAQEMRQRVIDALGAARTAAARTGEDCTDMAVNAHAVQFAESIASSGEAAPPPAAAPEARMLRLAQACLRQFDRLGIDLARDASRLRIETIDGFCAWLAAQLPIGSRMGGAPRIAEQPRRLYLKAARRTLEALPKNFTQAVDLALELSDEHWPEAQRRIADMLESRADWLGLTTPLLRSEHVADWVEEDRLRRESNATLATLVELYLQRALLALGESRVETLAALLTDEAPHCGGNALMHWREQYGALRPAAAHLARWRELANVCLTGKGEIRKVLSKAQGFADKSPRKAALREWLDAVRDDASAVAALRIVLALPDAEYSDSQWRRARGVAQLLTLAAAELDHVFREHRECDFTAVALSALRALGNAEEPTDLALRLDYRIEHLLIDEFQDVARAQLELLRALTAGWERGDGRTMFCVGDPMQAIYGFRAAEVRAFLQLAEEGLGAIRFDTQVLSSNFRAQPLLIEWTNAAFEHIFPVRHDRLRGAVAFTRSMAGRAAGGEAAIECRLFDSEHDEAEHIAELLAHRALEHPDWRMAVLVRTRRHAAHILTALERRGVAHQPRELRELSQCDAVRDLVMLTRALLHAADRIAWLALLRMPYVGFDMADVLSLSAAPSVLEGLHDEALSAALSPDGQLRVQRLRATLALAYEQRAESSLGRWVERVWLSMGGGHVGLSNEDWLAARGVFLRLDELEPAELEPESLHGVLSSLREPESEPRPIEVLTMHKAKGAEFDLVVLPCLAREPRRTDYELFQYQILNGPQPGFIAAARHAQRAGDALLQFLRWFERDAQRLEEERLLYVACTRTKRELWLTASADGSRRADEPFRPKPASLLALLWPTQAHRFLRQQAASAAPMSAGRDALGPARRFDAHWRPAPVQPPVHSLPQRLELGAAVIEPPFDWASETARHIGTLVHRELSSRQTALAATDIDARRGEYHRWLSNRGVPAMQAESAAEQVCRALHQTCNDARGRWILDQYATCDEREISLSTVLDGRIVTVAFDRMFIDAGGTRWVIDYKTSRHQGGDVETFLDNEMLRYGAQMHRYARVAAKLGDEPIRLALYFPLIGAWREWEPGASITGHSASIDGS